LPKRTHLAHETSKEHIQLIDNSLSASHKFVYSFVLSTCILFLINSCFQSLLVMFLNCNYNYNLKWIVSLLSIKLSYFITLKIFIPSAPALQGDNLIQVHNNMQGKTGLLPFLFNDPPLSLTFINLFLSVSRYWYSLITPNYGETLTFQIAWKPKYMETNTCHIEKLFFSFFKSPYECILRALPIFCPSLRSQFHNQSFIQLVSNFRNDQWQSRHIWRALIAQDV